MNDKGMVFISYAREDKAIAERLYMDLREAEVNAWMDIKCLKPGENWKLEIPSMIRKASYFLLLISKHSTNKRGYVQREIREGLEVLSELPRNQIYIIPVKLDDTEPVDRELHELNWVTLYPNYHDGLARILSSCSNLVSAPLITSEDTNSAVLESPGKAIHRGEEVDISIPLMVGDRAAVSYAPFRSTNEYFQQFIDRMPNSTKFSDAYFSYYFRVSTTHPEVSLGDDLLEQYPHEILLVLQHHYRNLETRMEGFSVILSFEGKERAIAVPYEAITEIFVPEIGLAISRR